MRLTRIEEHRVIIELPPERHEDPTKVDRAQPCGHADLSCKVARYVWNALNFNWLAARRIQPSRYAAIACQDLAARDRQA